MNSVRGLLAASVITVQNSCFTYPACHKCCSRLILHSRRFNCLKCGCTGEAKDASYRYRLSLKIADTNDLFDITVFGSCLDPFFGVTAENLQRCIQDFNQLSGETNTDASPGLLVQAVETCFIGKRFLFGVKGCAREDGGHSAASSILQNCSRTNRSTKKLTACQIFLPNTAVTGFTVISYFHRLLQLEKSRSCNNSSYLPDAPSASIDEPVSELSSLSSLSRSSCFVQSSSRESFLGSWQRSFSLTSSVAWVTAEDFSTLEVGKLVSAQHEQEGRPVSAESCSVSLNNQTLWNSQFCSSSVKEGEKEADNELTSQPCQTDRISATDKLERESSSKTECSHGNSSRLLQHPWEFGVGSIYPKTNSRNYSYLEKSHNSLFYKRDASASNHKNVAGASRVDSVLWDELPFSESLNEFLARIEDGKSVVTSPSLGAGKGALPESSKLGVNLNKSYLRQTLVASDLPEASVSGKFFPPAGNDSWENISFACLQSNANPLSDEVSQCESSSSVLSSTDKECEVSCFIPSPHLPVLSQSLPVTSEHCVSKSRYVQSKEVNTDISKGDWSFISLQSTAGHGEASCLKRSKAATSVYPACDICLSGFENKENSSSSPSQRKDLRFTGAWDPDPETPNNTRRIYKKELKPLTELPENTLKNVNRREMLWNSIFPEGSYNASADLFDASPREVVKPVEFLNTLCNSLIEEDTLTEKVTVPEVMRYPGAVPSKSSKPSSPLHRSPPAFSKHSTPVACSFCDSECSSVSTQDFVPYSQSTPVAKPLQKLWSVGESSSSVTIFTPKNPPKIHSKCKRSRCSFQNTLLHQLTGRSGKRERPSSREDKESYSSVSQQLRNSQPPADFEEWIPPSASKRLKPTASFNLKTVSWANLQLTCGHSSKNPISESEENNENYVRFRNERLNPGDTAGILTTPVAAGVTKALVLNDTVLETLSPLEGKNLLSSANSSVDILEGATAWSPELFLRERTPFSNKLKY